MTEAPAIYRETAMRIIEEGNCYASRCRDCPFDALDDLWKCRDVVATAEEYLKTLEKEH